ncbi:MAG: hypothetical protein WBD31_19145 [Rubripirellula sp.]
MTPRNKSTDDREPDRKQPSLRSVALCLPVVLIVLQFAFPAVDQFHEDEVYWIRSAYYYDLAFVERDLDHNDWQLLPARENPALGKYLIGATLHASGRRIATPDILGSFYLMFANMPGAWGADEAFEKRRQVAIRVAPTIAGQVLRGEGLPIEDSDLRTVRRLMCLMGILAAIGIMALSNEHRLTADIQEQILGGRLHDIGSRISAVATIVCGNRFAMLVLIALLGNQIRLILRPNDNDRSWTLMLIALWWSVAFVMLVSWIPFAWDRYALPVVAPSVLIVGLSIEHFVNFLQSQRTPGKSSP